MNKLLARILLFASLVFFFLLIGFCGWQARAEIYPNTKRAQAAEPQVLDSACCGEGVHSWVGKITEAKEMLRDVELKRSTKLVTYKEKRVVPSRNPKRKLKTITTKITDYAWKEAGLALMNVETGKIKLVKIKKDGQKLWNQEKEFAVEIEPRVNGITWNGRNTAFRVMGSSGWVVVANKWLERINGKLVELLYFPYSTAVHQEELITIGGWHLYDDVDGAFAELRFKNVWSLAQSEKKIGEVVPHYFHVNLVLAELTDPQEFYAYKLGALKYNPFDRVKVLLAGNGEEAFPAINYAGAVGLTQFTNNKPKMSRKLGTWDTVRKAYPAAELPEFRQGATNHIESIKAAILLHDYNLDKLVGAFRPKILDNPNLDLYLYAAHNCGISRVIQAIKLTKSGQDWRLTLRKLSKTDETNIFLEKVDYLLGN